MFHTAKTITQEKMRRQKIQGVGGLIAQRSPRQSPSCTAACILPLPRRRATAPKVPLYPRQVLSSDLKLKKQEAIEAGVVLRAHVPTTASLNSAAQKEPWLPKAV